MYQGLMNSGPLVPSSAFCNHETEESEYSNEWLSYILQVVTIFYFTLFLTFGLPGLFRKYSCLCTQDLLLVVFGEPYGVPGTEPMLVTCKASTVYSFFCFYCKNLFKRQN